MEKGIIYLATNIINDKKYVGQTVTSLKSRKARHITNAFIYNYTHKFYNALRKYGEENFTWEIIENDISEECIDDKEIYWVKFYNSYDCGYNMTIGGHSIRGYHHTQKTKKTLSENAKGKSNLDHYIKRYGEEEGKIVYDAYILSMKNRKGKKRIDMLIEKYGIDEGTKKYQNMVEKIKEMRKSIGSTNKKEDFLKRYGNDIGTIKYSEFVKKMEAKKDNAESKHKKSLAKILYWKTKKGDLN